MARQLSSWIDGFMEYTAPTGSPELWRKWTGIYTIAAALERKVHLLTTKGTLFPNLYTIMVGPAGAGKTVAADIAYGMLQKLEDHYVSPTSVTKASLIDDLLDAERKVIRPRDNPPVYSFNSLAVIANELGVLVPTYENEFINTLTDLYDCKRYSERRRTKDRKFEIAAPQLNFLAATTPSYLNNLMPEGAWDQGFISRTMLIYSGHSEYVDLFENTIPNQKLHAALTADLKVIGDLFGSMKITDDAIDAFRLWAKEKFEPAPDHPKLQHYNSRRQAHLLKLCMITSAATSDSLIITLDNYAEAYDNLIQAEAVMPDIFKSMGMGSSTKVIDEAWHFAYKSWLKDKKPIPEGLMLEFVSQRAPTHEVGRIIELMVKIGILKTVYDKGIGAAYEPRARK